MDMQLIEVIRYASNFSVLLPLAFYFIHFKRVSDAGHCIGILSIVSAVCDFIGFRLYEAGRSTIVIFDIYYLCLYALLFCFYYFVHYRRFRPKLFLTLLALYLVVVVAYFKIVGLSEYQTEIWTSGSIAMIILGFFYLKFLLRDLPVDDLDLKSSLTFSVAITFYLSFSFWLFAASKLILSDTENGLVFWSFHNMNNIVKNVIFAFGLAASGKRFIA